MNNLADKIKKTIITIDEIPDISYNGEYQIIDDKTIKYIEKCVRNSMEYRSYITQLHDYLDLDSCTFYEGYSLKNGLSIEIHHSPFTLYEYTETICRKHLEESKDNTYNPLLVAEEVVKIHYEFLVGLVPLNPTAHELVHSGNLDIHPDLVIGEWKLFIEEYNKYLSDHMKDKIRELLDFEKENDSTKFPKILNPKPINILIPYEQVTPKLIESHLYEKIKNIGAKNA